MCVFMGAVMNLTGNRCLDASIRLALCVCICVRFSIHVGSGLEGLTLYPHENIIIQCGDLR